MTESSHWDRGEIHAMEIAAGRQIAQRYDEAYETLFYETTRAMLAQDCMHRDGESLAVLDVGCGPGTLTKFFAGVTKCRVVGLDISPAMLRVARRRLSEVAFLACGVEKTPFRDNSFDVVVGYSVLHHLIDLPSFFEEVLRILKPGGYFAFADPIHSTLHGHRGWFRVLKLPFYPLYRFARWKNAQRLHVLEDVDFDALATPVHRDLTDHEVQKLVTRIELAQGCVRVKRLGILSPWLGGVLMKTEPIDRLIFKAVWYVDRLLSRWLQNSTSEVFLSGTFDNDGCR